MANTAPPHPRKSSAVPWIIVGVVGGLVVGGAVVVGILIYNAVVSSAQPGGVGSHEWSHVSPGCLVDANGDDILDIVGLTGPSDAMFTPTLLDGSSGDILWRGDRGTEHADVFCVGRDWFGLARGNFTVTFRRASSPNKAHAVELKDKLHEFGEQKGCVLLKSADGSQQFHRLPKAKKSTCPRAPLRRVGYGAPKPGVMGLSDDTTQISSGKRSITMRARSPGTPMLTLELEGFGKADGELELDFRKGSLGSGVAIAGKRILVWGADRADGDAGHVIGLTPEGEQLYAMSQSTGRNTWTRGVELFAYNGKYVVGVWGFGVHAYDPKTGKRAWNFAGRR